jgi:hypothetical protein
MSSQIKGLDFEIVKEPWNKYELGDQTILKTRAILKAIIRVSQGNISNYNLDFQNLQALVVPNEVKGTPAISSYSQQELESNARDIRYNTIAEEWNEYIADDGTKIRVKTSVWRQKIR